jgi:hypothetical protein
MSLSDSKGTDDRDYKQDQTKSEKGGVAVDAHIEKEAKQATGSIPASRHCLRSSKSVSSTSSASTLVEEESSGQLLREVFEATSAAFHRASEATQSPLNLLTTTPLNFSKFVVRVKPVLMAQNWLVSFVRWEQPLVNVVAVCLWILVCKLTL